MSEYITHIAVQEDTQRLALHADEICEAFKTCMRESPDAMRMGSASRGNSTFIIQNIHHFRDLWKERKPEDRLEDQLAYTLGWITHRAADRYFKPRYGIFDKNPENLHPVDIRIYHDVVMYDKVYGNGKNSPFSAGFAEENMQSHPAANQINVTQAEAIFGPLYQADFLALQSFDGVKSGKEFMNRMESQFATFTVDFKRLVNLVNNPVLEDMQQMIIAPNFYNDQDPIIKIARNIQLGESVEGMSMAEALNTEGQSQYAQTLSKAFNWIAEASKYFEYQSDKDMEGMYDAFNINDDQKIERY
ncbi:hypothetical protein [Tunicatimonas pelagia]|uniref:hypothetical protein n=1 Tax=Tunicatimonas pelagia TaxID=931531 RepID=UPI002665BFE1|nr:hypothetical protein [Tunicatimonas pelagia]WKN44995.1 hypothetical protein P0M28_08465 [Tunicatimonas pelagia]